MTSVQATLRILLVEDEALIAMLLEDMLLDLGHEVAATTGRLEHAMKLASELPIDFAILDVNLNGEQTFPLAAELKARRVPFVFSTGYGAAGLLEEWKGVPTLQKPFQSHELAGAILRATELDALEKGNLG